MKKLIFILIVTLGFGIESCKKLEEYNIDTKSASVVPSSTLFADALRDLADQETTPSVNLNVFRPFAQYWTETTYTDESNYDVKTRQIPDFEFRNIYRNVLSNLKEAKRVIPSESDVEFNAAVKKNKIAVTEILSVYAFEREVDIFGNIPYEQALDPSNLAPAYEDAQTIYSKLFVRLDAAIAGIDDSEVGFEEGDLVYEGDMVKWKKFAYSLKLKMAITVSDVPSLNPGAKAADAVAGGVFTSSDDNATFHYLGTSPNTNPVYTEVVATGRHDWVAANTIVDTMNALNDPRRYFYFEQNLGTDSFAGGPYGESDTYSHYTHINSTILAPDYPATLMSYTEVLFYLAEASERGFIAGSAATYYDEAITSSIVDDWGGTIGDATTYLANPAVAFATAPGSNLQKIGRQAWIAYYNRGLLGWTTWRRLDAPYFNLPPTASSISDVPTRLTYPSTEQTLNGSNYTSAASAIGGDLLTTRLFWDVNVNNQ
jgi:hypothetical protein